jgi:F420-non-reducing hydrogenase iron-sulfur subunit
MTTQLLQIIGINPKRLRLEWISAAEGQKFASLIHDFTKVLKELGPFTKKEKKVEVSA